MKSAIGRLARRWGWPGVGLAAVAALGAGAAFTAPPADRLAAAAETSLAERTRAQRLNAERCAAAATATDGTWVGTHSFTRPSANCAVQFTGSIAACASKGARYSARTVLVPGWLASPPGSPTL